MRDAGDRTEPRPSAWFRPDGKAMAWADIGNVRPWDLVTGQEAPQLGLYRQGIQWAGFSSDGRLLRTAASSGELGVWDAATGRAHGLPRKIIDPLTERVFFGPHYTPALDRRMVVVVTKQRSVLTNSNPREGRIYLWDPASEASPSPLREQVMSASFATLTPDSRFAVATEATGHIRVYDPVSGKPPRSFEGRKDEYHPTFSPDGTVLATTGADWAIRLYDFATGRRLRELKGVSPASCLAFAPDGGSLASGHFTPLLNGQPPQPGDLIYLWDTASGRELRRIPLTAHHQVSALSFSPDGRLIASCGLDGSVHLWEAVSGQERRRYEGHRSWVQSVDFAPEGGRLASASLDGTALVWQVFDPAPTARSTTELDALWSDLAKNGITAHRAIGALIAAQGTMGLLKAHVKPAIKPSAERREDLACGPGKSGVRETRGRRAMLARPGEMIEPALRRALKSVSDPEVRRRLTDLQDRVPRSETRPEQLRDLRAAEVLEHLTGTDSRSLLGELAKGAPEARLTQEAKASLERLAKKSAAVP